MHVRKVLVTNKDECVCVKSPASNILVEDITCDSSAGVSMGSFLKDTKVENIEFRNIQTYNCEFTNRVRLS